MQAGALGYLLKSALRAELLTAIHSAHAGQRYLPPAIAARFAEHLSAPTLTGRELPILQAIARGRSNKQIGQALGLTEDTIKRHVTHLLSKLRVADRAQAAAEGIRRGFIRVE
jgi:two-component system NarL family response regulator